MQGIIKRILTAFRAKPEPIGPSALEIAQAARIRAAKSYADARKRGDTRDLHWAAKQFQHATMLLLAAEREAAR